MWRVWRNNGDNAIVLATSRGDVWNVAEFAEVFAC